MTRLQVSISPFSALSNLALMSTNNLMMNDDKSKIIQIISMNSSDMASSPFFSRAVIACSVLLSYWHITFILKSITANFEVDRRFCVIIHVRPEFTNTPVWFVVSWLTVQLLTCWSFFCLNAKPQWALQFYHITLLLGELHWLPLHSGITCKIATLCYWIWQYPA